MQNHNRQWRLGVTVGWTIGSRSVKAVYATWIVHGNARSPNGTASTTIARIVRPAFRDDHRLAP